MADIIKPDFDGKEEDFKKDVYFLLELYKLLTKIVETICGGYIAIITDDLNLHYLRLCNRIEEILNKSGFEDLSQLEWRVFENLRDLDSADIDWEYGGRQICGNFLSAIEEKFINVGEKTYPLSVKDFALISDIRSYLQQYDNYKKNHESKWLENLKKTGEKNQKQTIKPKVEFPKYDFDFVGDEKIKKLLVDDFKEAGKAFENKLYKSTIVLCGGIVEALLIDALHYIEDEAKKSYDQKFIAGKKNKEMKEIEYWGFHELIKIAKHHDIIGHDSYKYLPNVKDYRNLIHLYAQKRDKLTTSKNTASAVIAVVSMVHDDVLKWHENTFPF